MFWIRVAMLDISWFTASLSSCSAIKWVIPRARPYTALAIVNSISGGGGDLGERRVVLVNALHE